jgi:hypothetical protein
MYTKITVCRRISLEIFNIYLQKIIIIMILNRHLFALILYTSFEIFLSPTLKNTKVTYKILNIVFKLRTFENVAGSVCLSLFMDGTVKCKLPSTYSSTGLGRIQHLKKQRQNFEFRNIRRCVHTAVIMEL